MKHAILRQLLLISCFLLSQFSGMASRQIPGIHIHTDREVYIAGETLFYRLYLVGQENTKGMGVAYLMIRNESSATISRICMKTSNGMASGSIGLPDTLQSGIYQLLAFTNEMRNAGEDHFFSKEILIANLFDRQLKAFHFEDSLSGKMANIDLPAVSHGMLLKDLKPVYQRGEEVVLHLVGEGQPNSSSVYSVSVREVCPYQQSNIGASESQNKSPLGVYPAETEGQIIRGRIINQDVASCRVFLSAKDTIVNLQYEDTDSNGFFRFRLTDYYQGKEVYIQAIPDDPKKIYTIEKEDKFQLLQPFNVGNRVFPASLKEYFHQSQDIFRVSRSYGQLPVTDTLFSEERMKNRYQVYDRPHHTVYPSDFEPLTNFQEISREILPTVRVRGQMSVQLLDEVNNKYFEESPALFVNGIYTRDFQGIMSKGTASIQKVEVVNARRVYGSLTFSGILALCTTLPEQITAPGIYTFRPETFQPQTRMKDFQPFSEEKIPDFRQLLYWNPALTIKAGVPAELRFYTSMHTGQYEITVEMLDESGDLHREKYNFNISRNP